MEQVYVLRFRANAKINFSLDICGKRADGYHLLSMVNQSITLHDHVSLFLTGEPETLRLTCNLPGLACDDSNLALRAAKAFFAASGAENPGIALELEKNIPMEAGLAGGSADAAAVLAMLNHYFGEPLSRETLLSVGETLGADVPFCLVGGTQLVEGIGEKMSPLPTISTLSIVLVKPSFSSSTAEAYAASDRTELPHPSADRVAEALKRGSVSALADALGNSFEAVVEPERISAIKEELLQNGASGCCMSGSGTAVYGIFESPVAAEMCRISMQSRDRTVLLAFPSLCGVEADR